MNMIILQGLHSRMLITQGYGGMPPRTFGQGCIEAAAAFVAGPCAACAFVPGPTAAAAFIGGPVAAKGGC